MATTAIVPERDDARADPPMLAGERESLAAWLELYRESLLLKIAGLDAEQLCRRAVPPSALSPLGIVRHLTEVETYWLREVLGGEDVAERYSTQTNPNADFDGGTPDTAADDVAAYLSEVARARAAAAAWTDLDRPVRGTRRGQPLNLRWICTHLIEEYARHLGHLDILREAIDGRAGY